MRRMAATPAIRWRVLAGAQEGLASEARGVARADLLAQVRPRAGPQEEGPLPGGLMVDEALPRREDPRVPTLPTIGR